MNQGEDHIVGFGSFSSSSDSDSSDSFSEEREDWFRILLLTKALRNGEHAVKTHVRRSIVEWCASDRTTGALLGENG